MAEAQSLCYNQVVMNKTILVLNAGSSSLKFSLLDEKTHAAVISGAAERLGADDAFITIKFNGEKKQMPLAGNKDHTAAIAKLMDELDQRGLKSSIEAVGHRVLHGGAKLTKSMLIDQSVIDEIERCSDLGPLHNPANLKGIYAVQEVMPHIPQVAVFDTAFHQTMPAKAYRYAVPEEWYSKYHVRRYGFHGTSYQYVTRRAAELLGQAPEKTNLVIAHIGNGASVAAIKNGQSVDTSMGLTPLEGLVMGTRAGSLDPAIIPFMMKKLGKTVEEILHDLNHKSGLLGISGISNDHRTLEDTVANNKEGKERAQLALEMSSYRLAKYVAAMMVALPRVDALVFTAGIGEHAAGFRRDVVKNLEVFGYKVDDKLNNAMPGKNNKEGLISQADCPKILVISTNEELMIAEETEELVKK